VSARRRTAVLAAALAFAVLLAAPATGAPPARTTGMFNDRYCEYLVAKSTAAGLVADVWNTYGLDDCPPALWKASDPGALKAQLGAVAVQLNGPRHWLMESASIQLAPGFGQVRSFHGLRMRRIASVQVPITNGVPGARPYTEITVNRANAFVWSRMHPVFELTAPDRSVYVMQSYAQIADPSLRLAQLPGLAARLSLPAGWHYRERRLRSDLRLATSGRATVVQDAFSDTYQLEHR